MSYNPLSIKNTDFGRVAPYALSRVAIVERRDTYKPCHKPVCNSTDNKSIFRFRTRFLTKMLGERRKRPASATARTINLRIHLFLSVCFSLLLSIPFDSCILRLSLSCSLPLGPGTKYTPVNL